MNKKLIVIVGPTASGKSELGIQLAKEFYGEIVSADSRQVYKGMEIGSGQVTKKEMHGIPHHLLSIISPKKRFTVLQYQKKAKKIIQNIQKQGKLPILVGGSPLYIYALVDNWILPAVKPNAKIRKELEKFTTQELLIKLKKLDPQRAKTIEQKNKRRLIRALEIVLITKNPVPLLRKSLFTPTPLHSNEYGTVLFLGIEKSKQELEKRIKKRFLGILKKGFLHEIQQLKEIGLSWQKIESFGLEYRQASQYLQKKITKQEMIEQTAKATYDFARRQMTWFGKDKRIHWVSSYQEAKLSLGKFKNSRSICVSE